MCFSNPDLQQVRLLKFCTEIVTNNDSYIQRVRETEKCPSFSGPAQKTLHIHWFKFSYFSSIVNRNMWETVHVHLLYVVNNIRIYSGGKHRQRPRFVLTFISWVRDQTQQWILWSNILASKNSKALLGWFFFPIGSENTKHKSLPVSVCMRVLEKSGNTPFQVIFGFLCYI